MTDDNTSLTNIKKQIDDINFQAEKLIYSDPTQAALLFERSETLAGSGDLYLQPYQQGIVDSLAGQAYMNLETKTSLAYKQSQEALELIEGKAPSSALALLQYVIGFINLLEGNYALALDWELKSLQNSRHLKLPLREAMALDAIAQLHDRLGEYEKSVIETQSALDLAQTHSLEFIIPSIMNNLAITFLHAGNYESALAAGLRALDLNCECGTDLREAYLLDTVGQILLSMKDYEQAENLFKKAWGKCHFKDQLLIKVVLALNLGRVYLAKNCLSKASEEINNALNYAIEGHNLSEQAACHKLLSEIYEKTGNLESALNHFKNFYEIEKIISNEESARQIAILNAHQDFENARRDSEIYRLRNIDLQHEIEERKKLETKLVQLATTDELTGIHNRRSFFERAQIEFNRAVRYKRPMTLLMLDLDHFKKVNDTYGHATGDHVLCDLCKVFGTMLRDSDILGRYGGEEFCIIMPDTNAEKGLIAAERLRKAVELNHFETSAGTLSITVSAGIAYIEIPAQKNMSLENLINKADHALYKAKQNGRNRVETDTLDD